MAKDREVQGARGPQHHRYVEVRELDPLEGHHLRFWFGMGEGGRENAIEIEVTLHADAALVLVVLLLRD
jgi:hypothetical protein